MFSALINGIDFSISPLFSSPSVIRTILLDAPSSNNVIAVSTALWILVAVETGLEFKLLYEDLLSIILSTFALSPNNITPALFPLGIISNALFIKLSPLFLKELILSETSNKNTVEMFFPLILTVILANDSSNKVKIIILLININVSFLLLLLNFFTL